MYSGCLSIVGGTGALGRALAHRALRHEINVCIGSRTQARADAVANELRASIPGARVLGHTNLAAAERGDMVVVTVPFSSQIETLREIKPAVRGKIVIDTTVPLVPPRVARVQLPAEHSAAVRAQSELGEETQVISALHTIAATHLESSEDAHVLGDVLVFGNDKASRDVAISFLHDINLHALHGGGLANSVAAEAMTSVLIFINKSYGGGHAGLRITGLPTAAEAARAAQGHRP
jgi:8-hydroxy-5-deazaflavin:NADPH oxidoreductase